MNIILGASGQIGSMIVENLLAEKQEVKAIIRNPEKAAALKDKGALVEIVDYFNQDSMKQAFQGGTKAFLLTPENPFSEDFLKDTDAILHNYHAAIKQSTIQEIVGLSSFGAQHGTGTGNLEASYRLEHAFDDLDIKKTFVRPSYYYSNWMGYYDLAAEAGILPTFFPSDMKVPMTAPPDVAMYIANTLMGKAHNGGIIEISGPAYSADDIAAAFSRALNRDVAASHIAESEWMKTLEQNGFTKSGANNLALMIGAVVSGKTKPEQDMIPMPTVFDDYIRQF